MVKAAAMAYHQKMKQQMSAWRNSVAAKNGSGSSAWQ